MKEMPSMLVEEALAESVASSRCTIGTMNEVMPDNGDKECPEIVGKIKPCNVVEIAQCQVTEDCKEYPSSSPPPAIEPYGNGLEASWKASSVFDENSTQAEQELAELKEVVQEVNVKNDELVKKIQLLVEEEIQMAEDIEEKGEEMNSLEGELEQSKKDKEFCERDVEHVVQELVELREVAQEVTIENDELVNEIQVLVEEEIQMAEDIEEKVEEIDTLADELEQSKRDKEMLESKLEDAQLRLMSMKEVKDCVKQLRGSLRVHGGRMDQVDKLMFQGVADNLLLEVEKLSKDIQDIQEMQRVSTECSCRKGSRKQLGRNKWLSSMSFGSRRANVGIPQQRSSICDVKTDNVALGGIDTIQNETPSSKSLDISVSKISHLYSHAGSNERGDETVASDFNTEGTTILSDSISSGGTINTRAASPRIFSFLGRSMSLSESSKNASPVEVTSSRDIVSFQNDARKSLPRLFAPHTVPENIRRSRWGSRVFEKPRRSKLM